MYWSSSVRISSMRTRFTLNGKVEINIKLQKLICLIPWDFGEKYVAQFTSVVVVNSREWSTKLSLQYNSGIRVDYLNKGDWLLISKVCFIMMVKLRISLMLSVNGGVIVCGWNLRESISDEWMNSHFECLFVYQAWFRVSHWMEKWMLNNI